MQGFLGEKLFACQTGQITPEEFISQLRTRAVEDAQHLRHLQKPETRAKLTNLMTEAGNDRFRAAALAGFVIELEERPTQEELNEVTGRLLVEKAFELAGKGEEGQRQAARLMARVEERLRLQF